MKEQGMKWNVEMIKWIWKQSATSVAEYCNMV